LQVQFEWALLLLTTCSTASAQQLQQQPQSSVTNSYSSKNSATFNFAIISCLALIDPIKAEQLVEECRTSWHGDKHPRNDRSNSQLNDPFLILERKFHNASIPKKGAATVTVLSMLGAATSMAYRVMLDMMDHQHAGTAVASLVATGALGCCISLAASQYYIAVTNGAFSSHSGKAIGMAGSDADGSQGQDSVQQQQMLQHPPAALLNMAQKLHDLLMSVPCHEEGGGVFPEVIANQLW